jgi:hypothetical protein
LVPWWVSWQSLQIWFSRLTSTYWRTKVLWTEMAVFKQMIFF